MSRNAKTQEEAKSAPQLEQKGGDAPDKQISLTEKEMNSELMRQKLEPSSMDLKELAKAARDNELDSLISLVDGTICEITKAENGILGFKVSTPGGMVQVRILDEPFGRRGFLEIEG